MYRLLVFTLLSLFSIIGAISDVNQQCINNNSDDYSNDNIIGTWYQVYRFILFGSFPASTQCTEIVYTKPTVEEIAEYKAKYNDPNLPYSLDENPIIRNDSYWVGMVTGNKVAKFYVLEPKTTSVLSDGYKVYTYIRLSDKFMMYQDCAMRGNIIWLLSNDRNASVEEMEAIIKATPALSRLDGQRFCATS